MKTNAAKTLPVRINEINSNHVGFENMISLMKKEEATLNDNFSKSFFYIQLSSLILAILSFFIFN